jgi:hypothetical protein
MFTFRPEHARVLSMGIQRVMTGDEILTRAFTPIADQLLDMVGRVEHGAPLSQRR